MTAARPKIVFSDLLTFKRIFFNIDEQVWKNYFLTYTPFLSELLVVHWYK